MREEKQGHELRPLESYRMLVSTQSFAKSDGSGTEIGIKPTIWEVEVAEAIFGDLSLEEIEATVVLEEHDPPVQAAFLDDFNPLLESHRCQEVLDALDVGWQHSASLVEAQRARLAPLDLGFIVVCHRRCPQILLVEASLDVKIGLVRLDGAGSALFPFLFLPLMDLLLE